MIGVVVIGRNEGDRLMACLQALAGSDVPVIYVDSGSMDESPQRAAPLVDAVLPLDPSRPFSAARARNEGASLLRSRHPDTRFVQFLDGDCLLARGWLAAALEAFDREPEAAVVVGHLRELAPERSTYNRLCALEWRSPAGLITNHGSLGGLMAVRMDVFEALGGFNEQVIAGEDSEFGVRVGAAGHLIRKLDAWMASHDADIHRFGQWWTRSVRAGHAIGQRAALNGRGPARDCVKESRSTLFWGLALPLALVAMAPFAGWLSLILLAIAYTTLAWRVFRFRRSFGDSPEEAVLYTRFNLLAKFANAQGLLKYYRNRWLRQYRIIEYK